MNSEPMVDKVEAELFRLCRYHANNFEDIRWLASVGECFDDGGFDTEDFGNLHWRLDVLLNRGLPVHTLLDACQAVLDSPRTRERNDAVSCGRLRTAKEPVTRARANTPSSEKTQCASSHITGRGAPGALEA